MPSTARGFRYPASSDAPNVPQHVQNLASDVQNMTAGGALCRPVSLAGNFGINGGGLPVGTTTSLAVSANRLIRVRADFQVYIPNGSGQYAYAWLERWTNGAGPTRMFAGQHIRLSTNDIYSFHLEDEEMITTAGNYMWKVAGSVGAGATATVDLTAFGSTIRSRTLSVSDVGAIPPV